MRDRPGFLSIYTNKWLLVVPLLLLLFFASTAETALATTTCSSARSCIKEGRSLLNQEQYGPSIEKFSEAIEHDGAIAIAYLNRASAYHYLESYEEALKDYTEAIGLDPSNSFAYGQRGNVYNQLGQYEEALKDYTEAIHLNPSDLFSEARVAVVAVLNANKEIKVLQKQIATIEKQLNVDQMPTEETQEEDQNTIAIYLWIALLIAVLIASWYGYKYIFPYRIKHEKYEDRNDDQDEIKNDLDSSMEIASVDSQQLLGSSQSIETLIKHFNDLRKQVYELENKLEKTDSLRKHIEAAESTLKSYINGYNFSVLKSAIADFIEAYEYASETQSLLAEELQGNASDVQKYITAISNNLKQGLEIAGIEEFRPEKGSQYSSSSGTEMIGSTPTNNSAEDGTIAEVVKPGWKTRMPDDPTKQKVLRKATVKVYKLSNT